MARSFKLTASEEQSLIHGKLPKLLSIKKISDLKNESIFKGGNIVFLAPDELIQNLRTQFHDLGIKNDLFSVREVSKMICALFNRKYLPLTLKFTLQYLTILKTKAKGLEFSEVALIGFFGWIERRGCCSQWQNCLRWLYSDSKVTVTSNTGQRVAGVPLEECDYTLSHPQIAVSDLPFLLFSFSFLF